MKIFYSKSLFWIAVFTCLTLCATTSFATTYNGSSVTQISTSTAAGASNQQILMVAVNSSGGGSAYPVCQMQFVMNNSTIPTNARLFYTTTTTFATTTQVGATIANPNGTITFTFNQAHGNATYYYWLAYDIPGGAADCSTFDASFATNGLTYSGAGGSCPGSSSATPTTPDPAGNRTIEAAGCWKYCTPIGNNSSAAGHITNVLFPSTGEINRTSGWDNYINTGMSASVVQGNAFDLSVTKTVTNTASITAWIDYNNNGSFADVGEQVMIYASNSIATQTQSITIPLTSSVGTTRMRVMFKYNGSAVSNSCETAGGYIDVEDYDINIVASEPCSGTPDAGNTLSTNLLPCGATNSFTLSMDLTQTKDNITYQWQSSINGTTYSNIGGATAASLATSHTASTYYQCIVTCTNSGFSDISTPLRVDYMATCYCTSNATSTVDSYIGNVTFNTINNSSTACTGYTDFTGVSTTVYPGMSYTLTITKGTCSGTYTGRFAAWIDWNLNGVFDASELVLSDGAASNGPVSVSVTVPVDATVGTARMRCIFRESTTVPSECGTYSYGETEDYSIVVDPLTACSGTPSAGTTSINPSSGCTGASVTMSSTASAFDGLTYQWQKSTDGGATWSNIGSAMNLTPSNYSDSPTASCSYRLYVICSNSGLSSVSNTETFTITTGTLSVKTWIGKGAGGTGTDFNDAANWNPASTPVSCDSIRMILNSAAVITMSANATIGALVYEVSGGVVCELDVQTRVLTINGTSTYDGIGSGTWAQVNVRSVGAGVVNKGNCVFHNAGTGISYLYAATSSPGFFQANANLTVGTGGRTAAGIEPKLIFDAEVAQSWIVNSNVTYFLGEDVIFGLINSPIITLGGGAYVGLSVYDGNVEINNSTIVKAMNVPIDKYTTTAGIFSMASGSKLELSYTNDMPVGTYTYNLDPNSTVEYLGASSAQSVNGITYGHLISGGSGNKTAGGNMVIAGNFLVRSGSTYLGSTRTHNFKQNFTNDGTFTANTSTFIMDGTVDQYIQGTVSSTFYNLTVNKSTGTGYLGINTQVGTASAGVMAFTAGPLNLNSRLLTINNAATGAITRSAGYAISENVANASKIQWNMGSTTGSHIYPFGTVGGIYIPFTFNLTAGTIGNVTLSTYPTATDNTPYPVTPDLVTNVDGATGDNSANTVDRFWQIDKTGGSGTATLTFIATPGEVGSISNLLAQRWNTSTSIWEAPLPSQISLANGATVPGVTNFSPWTLSGNEMPLPIELLDFSARYNGKDVDLFWSTASESNNDFFTIERTINGIDYEFINVVKGAGNSTSVLNYETIDASPYIGVAYYRLKQTDYNGTARYSQLETVIIKNGYVGVYPNPAKNNIQISFTTDITDMAVITIMDASGRLVHSSEFTPQKGTNLIDLNILEYHSGIYIISIENKNESLKAKFFKE